MGECDNSGDISTENPAIAIRKSEFLSAVLGVTIAWERDDIRRNTFRAQLMANPFQFNNS